MGEGKQVCHSTRVEVRRQFSELASPSTMWILRLKLQSSDLMARVISPGLVLILRQGLM